ncbi:uncharacterized protein LOC125464905 isoform X4 [Stegostoma tigrinum]|uniref:uncharacterized protein LOC125464905 isoform X4 n=1 Tax=Stegostoma tigrinum TaxID=3053191 RepID=UPI00202B6DA3|nr:uncharacterized protein LOC125464905 isoform X4 [Stegostoma tigrinum]
MSGIRLFCPCLKQGWDETVLSNLLQCSLVFYTLYYMIGSVCFGAFSESAIYGTHIFYQWNPVCNNSQEAGVGLFNHSYTHPRHTELCRIKPDGCFTYRMPVMAEFPLAWQWWLALGGGLLMMICNGQLVVHFVCQNNPAYSSSNL